MIGSWSGANSVGFEFFGMGWWMGGGEGHGGLSSCFCRGLKDMMFCVGGVDSERQNWEVQFLDFFGESKLVQLYVKNSRMAHGGEEN